VTLPIESDAVAPTEEESRVSRPPSGQPRLENVHVLVVEDDPDGNELITTILERYGARVTSVCTARDALAALDAETPNVLVSDIGLPDKDGIELIKQIRAKAGLASLPAIALTAYASRQDASKALAAGFDAHVAKPVQPGTLGTAVARIMARDAKPSTAA
jgi:CheY-like chemotaxis protein